MPKMKTKKGAAKRFTMRPGGTIKRAHAGKGHNLTKKRMKTKHGLRGCTAVNESDMKAVRSLLPNG